MFGIRKVIATALTGLAIAGSQWTAASACEVPVTNSPLTVDYVFTTDNGTALEMGIDYRDNDDYEYDHPEYCERLGRYSETDGYLLTWWECDGVPVNEVPRDSEWS